MISKDKENQHLEKLTQEQVEETIQKLKIGKEAGCNNMTTEMLKFIGKGLTQYTKLRNEIIIVKKSQKAWNKCIIISIYRKGDERNFNKYRNTTL